MRIPSGKTDQLIYFVAVDSTDLKTRKTGLSSFTVYRSRNGGTATIYTTPTIAELSSANMPGVYSLAIDEDTTIGASSDSEEYCVHITQASMAPVTRTIELYRRDTTSGNTLDVNSNGEAGIDWGNVGNKTTTNALTGTTIATTQKVDIETIKTNPVVNAGTITFPTGATLASTTNITAGTVTTATNVTTLNGIAANVITAAAIADGAIDAATFAAGAINAAAIAADAIGASELATDAVAEIAAAVWDLDATAHQTQGTFGQAIGDPVADTNTIYKAVVTDATGATVGADGASILAAVDTEVAAIKAVTDLLPNGGALTTIQADLDDIQTRLPAALVGGRIDASVGAVATNAIDADAIAADAVTEIQSGLATDTAVSSIQTDTTAIKAQTDKLTFTIANELDANIQSVNDVAVTGTGAVGDEWGP